MELRKLDRNDMGIIAELFTSVFMNEPWNDDWSDREQLNGYLTDLTGNPNSLTLGYFDGERLVGLAMGQIKHWYMGTEYLIDEFCIDRDIQRRGVGTQFVNGIREYLAERGIHRIFLLTGREMPAYTFYRKLGFEEVKGLVPLSGNF